MLTFVSILDLVCATILIWSIMSLKAMSDDRLDEIASSLVEVKDFVIQLNQLKVDKYSQDERILQMKLWLKVNEYGKAFPYIERLASVNPRKAKVRFCRDGHFFILQPS